KGMVLEDQQQVLSSIRKSGDSTALSIYNQWRFNKTFLGKEYLLPKAQRIIYLDSLEEATTQQEQELSRRSGKFKNQQSSQTITPNDIARNLHQGEASVEFIKFQLYKNKWTDSILYGALVLLPGDSIPKFEILFEENQLKKLIVASGSSAATYTAIQKLYGGMNSSNNTPEVNYSLYRLIWKPLEKYLSGVSNIYYVPAGLLHRISFQALRYSTSHYLLEKYQLNQLLSTRSIAYSQNTNSTYGSVNIWGNINYNITNKTAASYQNKHSNNIDRKISPFDLYALATRSIIKNGAAKLPSKMREIDSIQIMLKQMQVPVITTVGSGATEKAFKALNGKSQQVLHLATHGFFLPISQSKTTNDLHFANAFTMQQDPMFRSGLMLAGGNYAWKGGIVPPDKEDGILTAYELAQMDLSNTQLMVLSACETALGDLQGTEGVIGLQRAIKLAGVKQMIVSLWKVPDKETVELMTMFYRNWLTGQTTRQAMRNAQLNMKEKYSPFYWAAFVLVE
ncbi:MAG: CHAT domain-containing protein, partial [Segetibacter sp.]|nr:CHAT domain-containing protein [Segetibacter sp.]